MSVRAAFALQAEACAALGSPFTARLCALLGERLQPGDAVADRLFSWPGDISYAGASVPLRLAGALHALVLAGRDADLARAYAGHSRLSDDRLWVALKGAMTRHAAAILRFMDSPPQTNEVRRSAALIAAGHRLAAETALPFVLSELGASAGLNLWWDHFALALPGVTLGPVDPVLTLAPGWRGGPLTPGMPRPVVRERAGVDLNPLDPARDQVRILSYIWPDQSERLARTRSALDFAARQPFPVVQGDAADWLETRLATPRPGALHLICHTIAWQYFPPEVQARCSAALARAGASATPDAPIAHLGLENAPGGSAELTLTLWPGGTRRHLADASAHCHWIDWKEAA